MKRRWRKLHRRYGRAKTPTAKMTKARAEYMTALLDGEWHGDGSGALWSSAIGRDLQRLGWIDRDVARGAMYGITHHTRVRITAAGRAALRGER